MGPLLASKMRPKDVALVSGIIALFFCSPATAAVRSSHYIPEDPHAFPKFRVTFLNGLPVLNETADSWLRGGLQGGEYEFLDQPWGDEHWRDTSSPKGIDSGENQEPLSGDDTLFEPVSGHSLELVKIGPQNAYLCFIPPPSDAPLPQEEESQADVTPVHSWSLLQPLSGTCFYHRQGWFTYSYCHNSHVRQFREMAHAHPHPPGGYRPEEDPESEAYTLGRAPPTPEPGAELTVSEEAALAANLELARTAGSSYLVQRWGDGTTCDKTGKKREIEVQFHCSMTMTDTILFVKETKTCHYVMVIHTPRLCGEPGFKSRHEQREESYIRCREIVDSTDGSDRSLPETDYPLKISQSSPHKPILPPPAKAPSVEGAADALKQALGGDVLKRAFDALMGTGKLKEGDVLLERLADTDVVIEFVDVVGEDNGEEEEGLTHEHIAEALRAAGFDIKGERRGKPKPSDGQAEEDDTSTTTDGSVRNNRVHEEL